YSVGVYDYRLRRFKFYTTGNVDDRPFYCWTYEVDTEQRIAMIEVRRATVTTIDRFKVLDKYDIAGSVAVCETVEKSWSFTNNSGLSIVEFDKSRSSQRYVIGTMSFRNDAVDYIGILQGYVANGNVATLLLGPRSQDLVATQKPAELT